MVAATAQGTLYLFGHRYKPAAAGLGVTVICLAVGAVVAAILARTAVLAVLVYCMRGRDAIEWCSPSACRSFADWFGASWCFAGGRQQGLRVLGLGIALCGDHGQEAPHG
jgi:hypothetical protein